MRWRRQATTATRLAYGLALGVLAYVALLLAAEASPAARARLMRYWVLAGASVGAVAVPHVLFPDPDVSLYQLLNRTPRALFGGHVRRVVRLGSLLVVPGFILAFYDPSTFGDGLGRKSLQLAEGLLLLAGAGAYSLAYYATLGRRSQAWQEGAVPAWYRRMQEHSTTGSAGVPQGLVPAITATGRILVVAVLALGASAYAARWAPALALAPAALFAAWATWRMLRTRPAYDRHFYQTNAFYGEVFRRGARGEERAPVAYEAVYWAPARWRPAVWASLRQMDRRLPLGRLVALGHVLLWVLLLQEAAPAAVTAYLVLFAAAKNAACYVLATPALAPMDAQLARQSAAGWLATRWLVNLRWSLLWAGSLLAAATWSDAFTLAGALGWTLLDVALAGAAAALVTYFGEIAHRQHYA